MATQKYGKMPFVTDSLFFLRFCCAAFFISIPTGDQITTTIIIEWQWAKINTHTHTYKTAFSFCEDFALSIYFSSFRSIFDFIMHNKYFVFIYNEHQLTEWNCIYIYSHIQSQTNGKIAIMLGIMTHKKKDEKVSVFYILREKKMTHRINVNFHIAYKQ